MPFTLSHQPFFCHFKNKKKLSATALIIVRCLLILNILNRMQKQLAILFLGIFLIDFPLGFIVFAFHEIIKRPFIENAPLFKRLGVLKNANWINYIKIIFSSCWFLFLGAVSHLYSMTHWDGYLVQRFSFLI
jgi:hypothetical protein